MSVPPPTAVKPVRLLFDVLHPAHVHFFRPLATHVQSQGGEVLFTARRKDVTVELLEAFQLPFEVLSGIGGGFSGLARELAERCVRLALRARSFQPDLLLGIMGPAIVPVGRLLGIPSWVFYDTETARITNRYVYPMCNRLYLVDSYRGSAPKKAIRYRGFQELAYLHPDRFTADPSVRRAAGVPAEGPFAVVRIVSWEASHDVGDTGFKDPVAFVKWLSARMPVVVTGERGVPKGIEHLAMRIPPDRIHCLLSEASLYVGEGATMAAEAAILGTPAIFVHTARLGYMLDLEEKYHLLWNTSLQERAKEIAESIVGDPLGNKAIWATRRSKLLEENIDVASYLIAEVEAALAPPSPFRGPVP